MAEANKNKNYYEALPKSMKKKYHNPHYDNHLISVPFRMLVVAQSGGGKTNFLLELIHRMSDTFERIFICCKSKDEPLYEFLEKSIPKPYLMFFEGIKDIPRLEALEGRDFKKSLSPTGGNPNARFAGMKGDEQILIAFDDLVTEKDQKIIEDYFIRSRKVAGGVSCAYLSQSYFKVPKTIRLQCNYLVLKKLSSSKDLSMILKDFSLCEKKQLLEMYTKATSVPNSFLMIDVNANVYRNGFLEPFNTSGATPSQIQGGRVSAEEKSDEKALPDTIPDRADLYAMKVVQLRALLKRAKKDGTQCQAYSKLKKEDLVERLLAVRKSCPSGSTEIRDDLTALMNRSKILQGAVSATTSEFMSEEFKQRFLAKLRKLMSDIRAIPPEAKASGDAMRSVLERLDRYESVFK